MSMAKVAQVIVNHNSYFTDKLFDYMIPSQLEEEVERGIRVLVPFGAGNKKLEAYVFNVVASEEGKEGLKEIIDTIDIQPLLSEEQLKLIFWMKQKYLCKYLDAIHCIIPAGIVHKEKRTIEIIEKSWQQQNALTKKQIELLELLDSLGGRATLEEMIEKHGLKNYQTPLRGLIDSGIITLHNEFSAKVGIKTEEYITLAVDEDKRDEMFNSLKRAPKQMEAMSLLIKAGEYKSTDLVKRLNINRNALKILAAKGYVSIEQREAIRDPFEKREFDSFPKLKPTAEQQEAMDRIKASINAALADSYLIHGVTGSGKTEIYLQMIEEVLKQGKEGIVLVPEIALTPQTVDRFAGRFGDCITVFHSNLSDGERYDAWRRIAEGRVKVVIGARSAVFAPFKKLGIIIVDEEHESSYKSEQAPKYHTLEVAEERCRISNAVLLLGSATPSVETYHRSTIGELQLLTLKNRATDGKLPRVEIVDMKQELEEGNKGILSRRLLEGVNKALKDKRQSMLFLNRRGYSTMLSCNACGHVVKCSRCDISMTYHQSENTVQCHYCGSVARPPSSCPECSSTIKYTGAGTQRLEDVIQACFPEARLARLDLDTTTRKGAHEKILNQFKRGEIDILIGTQMISKGLDFPNVTFVGIISVDATLNLPDFRASEKTFQLITQVAGRAGRGSDPGAVVLQTYDTEHFSILAASNHDYLSFYREEAMIREAFIYPPNCRLIAIHFTGPDEEEVKHTAGKIIKMMQYVLNSKGYTNLQESLLGPNEAIIKKINKRFRYQILIKDHQIEYRLLKGVIKYFLIQHREKYIPKTVAIQIDTNPYSLM